MQIIQSPLLNNFTNLISCFTTKKNGNLAFHVDDNPRHVEANHINLAKTLGYKKRSLIHMKQIHSNIVKNANCGSHFHMPKECDALITNRKNTPLMVMVADCSPILFYDKKLQAIAVAHAGRQGAFKNIVKNTLSRMEKDFNSEAQNIYVSIGASIGSCCYEVGKEIYDEAKEIGLEYSLDKHENSYYLNISKILEKQLLACGIKEENIEISKECTCCLNDKYYSYRAQAKNGRFAGIIMLK